MSAMRRFPGLFAGVALLAPPACSTQEIYSEWVPSKPSPYVGMLEVVFAPPEMTYEEKKANASTPPAQFHLFVDGNLVGIDPDGAPHPTVVLEGQQTFMGPLATGSHHFELRTTDGAETVFAGAGDIPPAAKTRLYLFRAVDAIQGRFVSFPLAPTSALVHVSLTNLVRGGARIEAIACMEVTRCAPLAPALALGDSFEGDFLLHAEQDWPNGRYVLSGIGGLAYREVPSDAMPAPPVLPLVPGAHLQDSWSFPPPFLVAAPVYMSAQGEAQWLF
jgi:hypothetical protein